MATRQGIGRGSCTGMAAPDHRHLGFSRHLNQVAFQVPHFEVVSSLAILLNISNIYAPRTQDLFRLLDVGGVEHWLEGIRNGEQGYDLDLSVRCRRCQSERISAHSALGLTFGHMPIGTRAV